MAVGPAKFDLNWCDESPLRGEKPDFWPVSKNNTGSLPLRGILPVIRGSTFTAYMFNADCDVGVVYVLQLQQYSYT